MEDSRDILNDHYPWFGDPGKARDPEVESVSRIVSPSCIVEVAVALAWWTGDQNVDVAGLSPKLPFSSAQRIADALPEELAQICRLHAREAEVQRVCIQCSALDVECPGRSHSPSERSACFRNTKGHSATSGKQVYQPDRAVSGHPRTLPSPEPHQIGHGPQIGTSNIPWCASHDGFQPSLVGRPKRYSPD
jgi:hypothetical protein